MNHAKQWHMKNTMMSHLKTWWAAHPIIKLATKHSEIGSHIIVAGSMLIRNFDHLIEKNSKILDCQQYASSCFPLFNTMFTLSEVASSTLDSRALNLCWLSIVVLRECFTIGSAIFWIQQKPHLFSQDRQTIYKGTILKSRGIISGIPPGIYSSNSISV